MGQQFQLNSADFIQTPMFSFPFPQNYRRGKKSRSYPVEINNEQLSFAFIEVGCKYNKKRSQLKHKKELFLKYWGDMYKDTSAHDWRPQIFRIVSHYNPMEYLPKKRTKFSVDAIIHHEYISPQQLEQIGTHEKNHIYHVIKKPAHREIIEDIIETKNAEKLHTLILKPDEDNTLGLVRGKLAEILTQQAIDSVLDYDKIINYKNGHVQYINKRFGNGTEIDQILQFYGVEPFYELIADLRNIDNLSVIPDTFGSLDQLL